jgi:phage terminase large subunit GpA-like protein
MTGTFTDTSAQRAAFFAGIRPDPKQTIAEWADANMLLPSWSAEPGRWRTSRTPYLAEIMECLSPSSPVRRVVFMKCAQIGGTETGKNWIGYTVAKAPASMLIVEPTVDVAKKLSKQKIQPMFDGVLALKGKVKEARSRDSGNTILAKEYVGGMMVLTGANSGVGLRFMSAQNLFLDEVDAYPYTVDEEGPPVQVAEKRTLTYSRHKIYLVSTPLLKESSVIEPEYQQSDQRLFYVPCPFCRFLQPLYWKQLKWPKEQPELAKYECGKCQRLIGEHHKTAMLSRGKWIAKHPTRKTAGFHINALYAPYGWVNSWAHLAEEWMRIVRKRDMRQQQTFTNTNLAETWEEHAEKIESGVLASRCEVYQAEIPEGVVVLTAAADIQDDRIEAECIGWGLEEESWSIDYQRFYGSPAQEEVWKLLDQWLLKTWLTASNVKMGIIQAAIDSGGHHTKEAYAFVKARAARRIIAIKGSNQPGAPIVSRPSSNNIGEVLLYSVGTDTAKDTFFSRFKLSTYGPGYCHHPKREEYDEEFFAQLASEERRTKYDKGVQVGFYYKKTRTRNEALDLKVYNLAALAILNPNLPALAEAMQAQHAQQAKPMKPAPITEIDPLPPQLKKRFMNPPQRGRGGWVGGWK